MMTTHEAAKRIGCSERHVRTLIQLGKLKAKTKQVTVPVLQRTFDILDVSHRSVKYYAAKKQTVGFPRGQSRK